MNGFIFVVIAIAIIGSILSSVSKSNTAKSKSSNNHTKTQPSYPQQKEGGVYTEKKESLHEKKSLPKPSFQKELEKMKKEKDNQADRIRRRPAAMGDNITETAHVEDSMGEHQSEGSKRNYYTRYISIKDKVQKVGIKEELAKYIVMGEILNTPCYKKFRR